MHGATRIDRIGEGIINKQGLKMKIIKYTKYTDIDVEFEDGYVSKNKQYGSFKIGGIDNPNFYCANGKKNERLGKEKTTPSGRKIKIIEYIDANNITVMVDEKTEIKTTYERFENGKIDRDFFSSDIVGTKVLNKQGVEMEVIKFHNSLDCDILFHDEFKTIRKKVTYDNFINGRVVCPSKKNKLGGTITDRSRHNIDKKIKQTWMGILERTTNEMFKEKYPSYKYSTMSEKWRDFSIFEKWYLENRYYLKNDKLEVDKDFLIFGNKHYSEDTCLLLPSKINRALCGINRKGKYQYGVSKHGKKYSAGIMKNGEKLYLGMFNSEEEAFLVYKKEKEEIIHNLAIEYKDELPEKIFNLLIRWEFNYDRKL